ncbi:MULTISPECIES: alpha/beta hydrolase family protein [Pseudomonas]|uniref:Alpha/beta hydrolase family protein n=1 Tax=Pseudomonas eucalypticola TaxID=2599595 RepID=A0A7D5H348_9PSED|nr:MULTISPECIES: alpha/beta hydrolase family protein [Pseudomonas]QKZ07067.1 alpha/beta hydrolase family protein [Pseudomonas eucalypticola]
MSSIYRTTLPAFCLSLMLPLALPALADDAAQKPATDKAAEQPKVERQPVLERSQEDNLALERQLPQDEQQQLQAGSDSFLGLWRPANTSNPAGAVVIIPGTGETADWPNAVGPIRNKLPDANWHSLSISLPDLSADAPQPRVEDKAPPPKEADSKSTPPANPSVEQATATEPDKPPAQSAEELAKADAERIFARIDAAVTFAQQQKSRTVVLLGHGTGAYWAARYLKERPQAHAQRLVMVAPMTPNNASQNLQDLAPSLKVPTADIFYSDTAAAQQAAKARLQASKRLKDTGYTQISLNALPADKTAEQEQLFRRVRGWLSPKPVD